MTPRAVLAMPLYNAPATLPEALESLLTQSYRNFALVLVDDGDDQTSPRVLEPYLALDPRISYRRNDERLGLTRNWRRGFELALAQHPEAEYFAWASDHDVWHPRWLEAMIHALDARPEATLAFPDAAVIEDGGRLRLREPTRDTTDVTGSYAALDRVIRGRLRASHMVYGLFRVEAVRRAGGFRHVLLADRLLVSEVALQGPLVRVPETLWYRRITGSFSLARQRHSCFPGRVPLSGRLPWAFVHAWALFSNLAVRGTGRPAVGRLRGLWIPAAYLLLTGLSSLERRLARARKQLRRLAAPRSKRSRSSRARGSIV